MKKNHFGKGIIVLSSVLLAAISIGGCSSDDDYYENGVYTTRANVIMSRNEGENWWNCRSYYAGTIEHTEKIGGAFDLTFTVSWEDGDRNTVENSIVVSDPVVCETVVTPETEKDAVIEKHSVEYLGLADKMYKCIRNDYIEVANIVVRYRTAEEVKDEAGNTIRYKWGEVKEKRIFFTVDILNYRKDQRK